MDAITLLRDDHRSVEKLFKRFESAGKRALKTKGRIAQDIVEELSVHATIEEQVFYPAVRAEVADTTSDVLESLEEHHIVKWQCSEIDGRDPSDERFDPKVTVLIETVRHHVHDEENELFPKVRQALGRKRLGEIGDLLATAKRAAPTHPHPRTPDTPPANIIGGLAAGAVDKVRDAVKR